MKAKFVLDTSAFTNLGTSKGQINRNIKRLIGLMGKVKNQASIYCPPSIWTELLKVLGGKKISRKDIQRLDVFLIQKSPSRMELLIPSEFIYHYVGDVRERFNRGLREAEKAVIKMKHGKESHEKVIKELRDGYRIAIRKGILDSKEDLDVLILAKEMGADVVAKDAGIREWAEKWGIRYIDANSFPRILQNFA